MVAAGNLRRKWWTDSAIELTWPGVPVTACAIMRPARSKMPADRSPASRTVVENAVRIIVCACSSTTAIRRFHMIWRWICARAATSCDIGGTPLAPRDFDVAKAVHGGAPALADKRRGFVLGDDRRAADG